jgi:hypothetical protein
MALEKSSRITEAQGNGHLRVRAELSEIEKGSSRRCYDSTSSHQA